MNVWICLVCCVRSEVLSGEAQEFGFGKRRDMNWFLLMGLRIENFSPQPDERADGWWFCFFCKALQNAGFSFRS